MHNKKLINICGTARSGSTMLDLIIGNDQKAFSLGEVNAFFRPYRTHHFNPVCSCAKDYCPWPKLRSLKEMDFHKKCFEILNVDVLVDSSKTLPWVIDSNIWAKRGGYSVYNVLIYKEPISLCYSFWKRGLSIDKAINNEFKTYYKRFFETNIDFVSLNYNKFSLNPTETTLKICSLLNIPYFEGKERFWEKEHHHIFGSFGIRKQVESSISRIKSDSYYPENFQRIVPIILAKIRNDFLFNKIFSVLESKEISSISMFSENKNRIYKPYWYYLSTAKQKLRKKFPKKWLYHQ